MPLQVPQRTYYATAQNTPGLFDFLSPDYQLQQQKVDQARSFSGGVPTDASGNPDYGAMAKTLLQKGDFADAGSLLNVGIQQQGINYAFKAADSLGGGGGQPSASSPGPAQSSSYTRPVAGFDNAVSRTLGFEGGLNKSDTNGTPTNYGINQAANPDVDVASLTPDAAKSIYKQKYWDAVDGDNLSPAMSRAAFDTAVIAGPGKAKELMAQSGGDPMKLMTLREQYQQGLLQSDPAKYGRYAKAWAARNNGLRYDVMALQQGSGDAAAAPSRVAQNGAEDSDGPVSGQHPYAPSRPATQAPAAAPQSPSAMQVAGPGAPSPAPVPVAPAPNPTNVPGQQAGVLDPTFGGLLPQQYAGNPGGYVAQLRAMAVRFAALKQEGAANAYNKQADGIERGIERNNLITPEMKNYQIAVGQGFQGTMMDFQRAQEVQKLAAQGDPTALRAAGQHAAATAGGTAQGEAPYKLMPVQATPGAPTTYQSAADIAASNSPVASKQPPVFAQQQDALGKQQGAMVTQMQKRQVAQERLDAMSHLLETFQSGAGADQKAAAIAGARALGFNIPDSATGNPAAVEQFVKNASANVFSQAGDLGGKVLVSELEGLKKANANPNMQPASNAAIIAQQKGLLQWQDAHDQAFFQWHQANPYAYDSSQFEQQWMKANPPSAFVEAARKNIAALGAPIPPKAQLVDGQAYMIRGAAGPVKARWSATANGFVPVGSP